MSLVGYMRDIKITMTKYNDEAEKYLAKVWQKFFLTPKGKKLIEQADCAEEFLRKLAEK